MDISKVFVLLLTDLITLIYELFCFLLRRVLASVPKSLAAEVKPSRLGLRVVCNRLAGSLEVHTHSRCCGWFKIRGRAEINTMGMKV